MKPFFRASILALLAMASVLFTANGAMAQAYPYTSPSYTPNAVGPTTAFTAPGAYPFDLQAIGTVSLRVTGTCTSLAAVMQASNDGGNTYTTINLYPVATGTTAPTAVASIGALGFWKANTSGFNRVRLNITALTASCVVTMVGSPHTFNGVSF